MNNSNPNYRRQSTLAEAKARLNIHALWLHFGFEGEPRKSCKAPWRDDHKPSFSVNPEGTLWHDFATGESGDQVDFFRRASGLLQKPACLKFIELAGGHCPPAAGTAPPPARMADARLKPTFPVFRTGAAVDFQQLANLRRICREGLEWAAQRGLLWFATLKGCPAWIVTDSARLNAQARRMDGQPWLHIGSKAWTLPGAWASWPIGILEACHFPTVALCEGGPDLLAAHWLALSEQATPPSPHGVQCAPVAMLGAVQRIHADALPLFAGKRVRIFGHADAAGRIGVTQWARQLAGAGAKVDAFTFAGLRQANRIPVKDLNDFLLMEATNLAQQGKILP